MTIFQEISQFAKQRGAVYIGATSLSNLALDTFRSNVAASQGQILALAKLPYFVRLDDATGRTSGDPAQNIGAKFEDRAGDLFLVGSETVAFKFSFGVFDKAGGTTVLSEITLECRDIRFEVSFTPSVINCEPGEAQLAPTTPTPTRDPNFDAIVAKEGLDPTDVTRVEGMLFYGSLATVIAKAVQDKQQIALGKLFPSISFQGSLDSGLSQDSRFLFISGRMTQVPGCTCACTEIGDGIGPTLPGTTTPDAKADPANPNTPVGGITIGGPQPVKVGGNMLGPRHRGTADSGIYMPRSFLEPVVAGPFPAIRIDISDNGFIGWKAAAVVDFANPAVKIDATYGRIVISFDFRLEVYGSVHVDLGKLGKIRVTTFSAEQDAPAGNHCEIDLYLVIGTKGIYLKPVLEELTFSKFHVNLRIGTIIGSPFGGWGAVIGFIFDQILSRLIEHEIPLELNMAMRDYMAKAIFPLINANYALELTNEVPAPPGREIGALFDGSSTALLASAGLINNGITVVPKAPKAREAG